MSYLGAVRAWGRNEFASSRTYRATRMVRLLAIAGICASIALVACGDDDDDDGATTAAGASAAETTVEEEPQGGGSGGGNSGGGGNSPESTPGIEITTADSQFGDALFDADQRAIYYFDKEQTSASECYGDCAVAWPPVLTEGEPQARGGADAKLLGTTKRDDGSTQVTYDGRPLYYYVDDPVGQIACHNVSEFGGLWLAVQPNGDPVA
jgi:predicted lipoprotein with Yx(FWY)xxD motif